MVSYRADSNPTFEQRSPWTNVSGQNSRSAAERSRVVGFFPGLGSRGAYRDVGRNLLDCGVPEVAEVYHEATRALGHAQDPERLLLSPNNLPDDPVKRQGFIGAAFLVHGLALHAHVRAAAEEKGVSLVFAAYTGESFGIIASAVASGSLSCGDGVRIARAFTPLMMLAADGGTGDDPFAESLVAHLPDSIKGRRLVPEPSHVVALKGDPEDLAEALTGLARFYPTGDVEVHKLYSRRQTNVYIRTRVKPGFDMFMKNFSDVTVEELKDPTTFLAHSARMRGVRVALERFIAAEAIVFRDPHTPIIANHGPGLLETADEVYGGILAMVDEAMASRTTVETLIGLRPDIVLELGLGGRSLQLLADNGSDVPAMAYAGTSEDADLLLRAVGLMSDLQHEMLKLHDPGSRLTERHLSLLRDLFRLAQASPFSEDYLYGTMVGTIASEMLRSDRDRSPAFYRLLEIFQHTHHHRRGVDVATGELIFQSQSKKTIDGRKHGLGQVYADLKIIDGTGAASDRTLADAGHPEVVVFHFERLAGLSLAELARNTRLLLAVEPSARRIYDQVSTTLQLADGVLSAGAGAALRTVDEIASSHIVYQYALFQSLRHHRPAVFAPSDYYIEGSDLMGWLVALAVAGACPLADVVALYSAYLRAETEADEAIGSVLDRTLASLKVPDVPVISPAGIPIQARKDLEAATRDIFGGDVPTAGIRELHLNGNCHIVSLGAALAPERVSAGPHAANVISIRSPGEIWERRSNPVLDAFEELCLSTLTDDNAKVLRFAQDRKLLSSTVYAYVNIGERIIGFGKGGSESMTMFFTREAAFAE